jgi:hypothetical protein
MTITVSGLSILCMYLMWAHERLRKTVKKLKTRIDKLEHPAIAGSDTDWGYYGDDDGGDDD